MAKKLNSFELINVSDLVAKYCSEAREHGFTCRDEMVRKPLDTGECGPEFSDSELVVASRIRYEL